MQDAVALAEYLNASHRLPEQVQDFYPVPGCLSTCMYHTGIDPRTMKPVYVATDPHEKALQRALLQWKVPENWKLVREALQKAGREDLIGFDARCLIRPYPPRPKKGGEKGSRKVAEGEETDWRREIHRTCGKETNWREEAERIIKRTT